ncbi:G protein-coupled receptor kinase G protein-coupled receptor kinase 2 [Ectocarpus siliculosus]|uniref:G protein-coupled receptor kinase G protein-coupled receptor kinase 2 n=1 Tax=Ectocarpus siliculosus TaxID=2880 RepID=D7FYT9_ECTSI|nr:G protein-coupled receptor kinase G protein-coupled receptor kinase 2 [Ectocarpus siliculosus]|eukprot:CBJ26581.1 G protein-coupled receptor kinase G protein-coupled receptor kinase 2 [Ectocarpus siliculosus]
MEELQDAIEDVQYLQAVNSKDSGPSPTEAWPFPSEKELEAFNTARLKENGQSFSLERICGGVLGLYLFGTFCTEMGERSKFEFMLDVIRYRRLRTPQLRLRFAQGIIRKFLLDVSTSQEEMDVLVDKAPILRQDSTPACLAELERRRSDIRTDGGVGVNRLGVVGPLVEQLVRLLPSPARASGPQDSIGVLGVAGGQGGVDDKSGKCSLVNTADMSEEEADEQPIDAAGQATEQQRVSGGEPAIGQLAGNGVCHAPGEVAHVLTGGHDEQERPSGEPEAANATTEGVQDQPANVGVTRSSDPKEEWYQPELFNVLEAWILEYLREKLHCGFLLSSHFQEYTRFLYVQHRPVTENDFILFRILGRGGFGAVNGCKRGSSGKLFAMKVMNKRRIKIRQSEDLCWNERRILEALGSPFVVSLKYAFESKNDLFLILDLMTGGDLGFHLQHLGIFTKVMAQYYTARTVLGIQHLHQKGIVYRDLKPENVMLDEYGRSRISDMGLACKVTPHLTGACGTRGYWAPEMRLRNSAGKRVPYNECVDWFSLGCILYEFLRGMSPFRTERAMDWCADTIQDKEKRVDKATLEMEPEYPPRYFDSLAIDLCTKLMMKDPQKRLGRMGADEILAHPWFGNLDRDALVMDQVESPYVPNKDINAAPQRSIGSFADTDSKIWHTWHITHTILTNVSPVS